jgi:threonylcarbamoyladenosine tRNA methylthiotransferase MtaB
MAAIGDLPVHVCSPDDSPDIVIVNACTVTMNADRDGRAAAYRAARTGARVILAGCLATRLETENDGPGMPDGILVVGGTADRARLLESIRNVIHEIAAGKDKAVLTDRDSSPANDVNEQPLDATDEDPDDSPVPAGRSRPMVKIQDGCDCRCTYCIVPLVRGPSVSFEADAVIQQVKAATASGAAEIVLTGVDLAAWGKNNTTSGHYGQLPVLLDRLTALKTGARFRLSSLEPHGLDGDLISAIAGSPDICPHLHIPLQSGSNAILARMNRPYDSQLFEDRVMAAAARISGMTLGLDVIVGFPGETDEDFQQTFDLINRLPTTYLHVFAYSPRPGTPAATMDDQIPDATKKERSKILRHISVQRRKAHIAELVGTDVEVVDIRACSDGVETLAADYTKVLITNRFSIVNGRRTVMLTDSQDARAIGQEII